MSTMERLVPGDHFPAAGRVAYLNTGTVGITPDPVLEDAVAALRWYHSTGPALPEPREFRRESKVAAGESLARFLGASRDEVEILEDTTAGINAAVAGLRLQRGDRVVVSDVEHYAGRVTWAYAADRLGLEIDVVPARGGLVEVEDVEAVLCGRTRVVSLSHVSFMTGSMIDAPALGSILRERGIFSVLDAAQSLGVLDVAAEDLGWDLVAFPGYKWCLGPEGTGGFYLAREAWDRLDPPAVSGGGMLERTLDGEYTLAPGARRYADSNPSLLDHFLLGGSLDYLGSVGLSKIEEYCRRLADAFVAGLGGIPGAELITPEDPRYRATLIVFTLAGADPEAVASGLFEAGIHLRTVPGTGGLRASFHLYNTMEDVEALLHELGEIARGGNRTCTSKT